MALPMFGLQQVRHASLVQVSLLKALSLRPAEDQPFPAE